MSDAPYDQLETIFPHPESDSFAWLQLVDLIEAQDQTTPVGPTYTRLDGSVLAILNGHKRLPLAVLMNQLELYADVLLAWHTSSWNLGDLESRFMILRLIADLTPTDDARKPARFKRLAEQSWLRYKAWSELGDLDYAVSAQRQGAALLPPGHSDESSYLVSLAGYLHSRYGRDQDITTLNEAIHAQSRAASMAIKKNPGDTSTLHYLKGLFVIRYVRLKDVADLSRAIKSCKRLAQLTPDDDKTKPDHYNSLATILQTRYDCTSQLQDLEEAITSRRLAIELSPDDHPDKASRLSSLGSSLRISFERTKDVMRIDAAIAAQSRAVEITPDDKPLKASWINNLGNSLLRRFERFGRSEDITNAIAAHTRAVGSLPETHHDLPNFLGNLGTSLTSRYDRFRDLDDLEHAIAAHRRMIRVMSGEGPNLAVSWNSLGNSLMRRFECLGELMDIEDAISAHRRALDLTPDEHPKRRTFLEGLAAALIIRFERNKEPRDIDGAIALLRRCFEFTSSDNPTTSVPPFNSLGNALMRRFERTRNFQDIDEAVAMLRREIDAMPDNHISKPGRYTNLGHSLGRRAECSGALSDIDDAIWAHRRAIMTMPPGFPEDAAFLSNLGNALTHRFEHVGDQTDIEESISVLCRAIELTPHGHPSKPKRYYNLGAAYTQRFQRHQTQRDFDLATKSFLAVIQHPVVGATTVRFTSAQRYVHMHSVCPRFSSKEAVLAAHSHMMAVIPEVVWLGHSVSRRLQESSQLGKLVGDAVSTAIRSGLQFLAVEWLEAGRALIWSQVLSLRTPIDVLQEQHPGLAQSLRDVQQKLQRPAYDPEDPSSLNSDTTAGMLDLVTQAPADRHVQLVVEYERLLTQIRGHAGFADFQLPKRLPALLATMEAVQGPVILINVDVSRCDAFVILPQGEIVLVPLPQLTLKEADALLELWRNRLSVCIGRSRGMIQSRIDEGYKSAFTLMLRRLWTCIVFPILNALDLASFVIDDALPHITWCPTGPLASLPIHAAGIYDEPYGPRVFDFAVSSYIPSLASLSRCYDGSRELRSAPKMLVVTQPETPGQSPLPATGDEASRIVTALSHSDISSTVLDRERATVDAVERHIGRYSWVHLSCHGNQNTDDATQSAFALHDGPLTLAKLMGIVADDAEIAFLSACQTAVGDVRAPEESAHLAAGMLAAGFKGVVATMCSIVDDDAPIVVEAYYRELLALRAAKDVDRGETGAAYALHEAVGVLREQVGVQESARWVPFVHFGA
ncbi:unnamed protein product [Peniophora sp. CBMAI 1063]|nr:unnamed protein product [Peniophora sp. CBMAI 1063]